MLMAENSSISWTDHTFNCWRGCEHALMDSGDPHPGCLNCYAEKWSQRNPKTLGTWGGKDTGGIRVRAADKMWTEPLRWNERAQSNQVREKVFCASLADVFEDWQGPILNHKGERLSRSPIGTVSTEPGLIGGGSDCHRWLTMDDLRRDLFQLIDETPWLDWLLLTKRPQNVRKMWRSDCCCRYVNGADAHHEAGCPQHTPWRRNNVWLGTTVSDHFSAEQVLPHLLRLSDLSPVLWVSAEPLLGPINFERLQAPGAKEGLCYSALRHTDERYFEAPGLLKWIVAGGESKQLAEAREYHLEWPRDILRQCRRNDVAFFHKQVGDNAWLDPGELQQWRRHPEYKPLKTPGGKNPIEWPLDVRVQDFPTVEARA